MEGLTVDKFRFSSPTVYTKIMSQPFLALPRPGTIQTQQLVTIAAPKEADFVSTFGQLLPSASYLSTKYGKAAYYSIPPTSKASNGAKEDPISRVLMVHGVQTCAIGLQPLAKTLSSRFPHAHIVLVDLWGHGLTDAPVTPYEPALFHFLLESLMTHLHWDNAHFIGYSFGGSTVATFASVKRHLVSSLILVAPAGLMRMSQFTPQEQTWLRGDSSVTEQEAQKQVMIWLEDGPLVVPPNWKERVSRGEVVAEAVKEWQMVNHEGHAASVVAVVRDGGVFDMHEGFKRAAGTGVRNFSVLGELDPICSVSDLKDVGFENVVMVNAAGHGVVREQVPEVARYVEEFWKGLA